MTASERARDLTDALVKGAICGAIYREHDKREDAQAALLAYVADLEAVAQAVRDWRLAPHRHDRRAAMQRASDGLAALGRPEDGDER